MKGNVPRRKYSSWKIQLNTSSHQLPSPTTPRRSNLPTSSQTKQNKILIRQKLDTTRSRHIRTPIYIHPLSELYSVSEEVVLSTMKKMPQKSCEFDPIPTSMVCESRELLFPGITNSITDDALQSGEFSISPGVLHQSRCSNVRLSSPCCKKLVVAVLVLLLCIIVCYLKGMCVFLCLFYIVL